MTDSSHCPSSTPSSCSSNKTHAEMVTYVFDNISTLRRVLENDKALSNMLYDMVLMPPPLRYSGGPSLGSSTSVPQLTRQPAPNRPRWGDED